MGVRRQSFRRVGQHHVLSSCIRSGWRVAASGGGWQEMHRVGTTILGRPRPSRDARPYQTSAPPSPEDSSLLILHYGNTA
jgi:hypothetical protein